MDTDERPLLVQLSWTAGGREGRFVLKRDQDGAKVESSRFFSKPAHGYSGAVLVFQTPHFHTLQTNHRRTIRKKTREA